jgi:NTP pyrophosphatase (non-canonical NTP hydrolase)
MTEAATQRAVGLPSYDTLGTALVNVKHERFEQERLKAEGRFRFTCADPDLSMGEKLAILMEEVGEVAQQVLEQPDRRLAFDSSGSRQELREELEQVAAVAVAWVESLLAEAVSEGGEDR